MPPLGNAAGYELIRYIAHCDEYTIALLTHPNGSECVGVTWNGTKGRVGFPQSFGNQVWFILPEPIAGLVLVHERAIAQAVGLP